MITRIEITREQKSIPTGFVIEELQPLTVITGENNSGKTNFVKAVQGSSVTFTDTEGVAISPKIIYIAAENINPSDSETKSSAKGSGLINNLTNLFSTLDIPFELTARDNIVDGIRDVIEKANENLENFCGHNRHELSLDLNEDQLSADVILQALINGISGREDGTNRNLDDLGQGTQRLVVASILKAYRDILLERQIEPDQPVLILFEEPEIYLHPKIKRVLNTTLEEITNSPNHQVIITTHDPYFTFQPFTGINKKIISFVKTGQFTRAFEGEIFGIEDELLFIFLYSQLKARRINTANITVDGWIPRNYFKVNQNGEEVSEDLSALENIRHQIHHSGDNPYTQGLVSEVPTTQDLNYYTDDDLSNAIRAMSGALSS